MQFFLDENLSEHVADALNSLGKGYFPGLVVESTKRAFGVGKTDQEIIPEVGKVGGVLVTRDKGIGHLRGHSELCRQWSASVIFISLPGSKELYWELVVLLIRYWKRIVDTCNSTRHPFAFKLTQKGFHRL